MNVIMLGPAGSGKSLLTGKFGEYLRSENYSVNLVNLDPGAYMLPYTCDYDIRDYFTIEKIMKEESLGPNGAMLRAMEKLSRMEIPEFHGDFVLVDTPGQLETFAFHESGPNVVSQFEDAVGLFLIDPSIGARDLPAAYLYRLAISYRLGISVVTVINKVDLIAEDELERIRSCLLDPVKFKNDVKVAGALSDLYVPLLRVMKRVIPAQRIPLVSAKTGKGLNELLDILYEVRCVCGDLT
ncbi:MAG: ATP/GTP-binding protein [Nitrososphaerota archaeon]|nr:ATP/GTP-binding protein [Candidatus Bathyarchaeota archaeon]MDW8048439.1 ATP/GTP-binding protein [Nitrososphaerota archaeon]